MNLNPLTAIDFYKADHRRQYPKGTQMVFSNFTPRSTKHSAKIDGVDNKVVFFGLQYFIKWFLIDLWNCKFFTKDKKTVVAQYKRRLDNALGKDAVPVDHIEALHDLRYLPLEILALPEGSVVEERVPVFVIFNTKPEFFWLTNYMESILSNMCWKSCTSATTARKYRILLERYAKETGGSREFVKWQAHDFSFRGMGGPQDAIMSGAGHLLSFAGTDTVSAIDFLEDYYNADSDKELVGGSVPATEHSVMCMGSKDAEIETFERLINEVYPKGIVSIVSDTWDYWKVITEFLPKLKKDILKRDGKVVIRPDSGDPVDIICGDPNAIEGSSEFKGSIECMWDTFGGTMTSRGYKLLDPHIGLIYGDSITLERCERILRRLKEKQFAATNIVFGVGSYTYEYVTRDTLGFAMKATAGKLNDEYVEIWKDPKTDTGMKKSARGFLIIEENEWGDYVLKDQLPLGSIDIHQGALKTVFKDGKLLIDHKFSDIKARLDKSIPV